MTTNYDELVERAFRGTGGPQLVPILDAADLGNLQPMALPYLKLHGCISRQDRMVASTEDLYDLRRERQPLVSYIESLHLMGPVIYVGYSFRDTHIIDLIFDLNRRLGRSRQPFLFVGHESDPQRAQLEGDWFRQELQGHYLPVGFEQFMSQLAVELRSFNRTSRLIGALAPCRAEAFWVQADAEIDLKETKGNVECWLTYKIRRREGFAGVNLVPARGAADLSSYSQLTFELNIGDEPRQVAQIEALNMRDIGSKMHFNIVGVAKMRGQGWYSVKCDLGRYTEVNMRCIDRVALADNGSRAKLNRRYRVGLRNVRLEK